MYHPKNNILLYKNLWYKKKILLFIRQRELYNKNTVIHPPGKVPSLM